ncbi:MAG: AAA family ATPase, partial [Chitinophagales bacterium]
DDSGQAAKASITSLRYSLSLKLNQDETSNNPIQIVKEELEPISIGNIKKLIFFENSKEWLKSAAWGRRANSPFISTLNDKVKLHSDAQEKKQGRTTEYSVEKMPRTFLSTVTAESPTAFLVRYEMRNWMLLQFEPSALRQPNTIFEINNAKVTENGHNLPATLYRLNNTGEKDVYQNITNQVKDLVTNIKDVDVDKDDKRDLLTLQVKFKDGLILPAQSLSDGTLRYLGLAVINEDNKNSGLICMEEPENGINPSKIDAIVELLENIATDTSLEINTDNPLRQVIINTHSPIVVSSVSADSLYLASEKEVYSEYFKKKIKHTTFSAIKGTWKTQVLGIPETTLGEIDVYLGIFEKNDYKEAYQNLLIESTTKRPKRTVKEYFEKQKDLFSQ